jgi:hypothetical protein
MKASSGVGFYSLQMSCTKAFPAIPPKQDFYFYLKKGIFFKRLERWLFLENFV